MQQQIDRRSQHLDPILTLPLPSPSVSLCFLRLENQSVVDGSSSAVDGDDDESDSGSDDDIQFRSSGLLRNQASTLLPSRHGGGSVAGRDLLKKYLVSCHRSGEVVLWDLNSQKVVHTIADEQRGPGLAVKRTANNDEFLFQSRGEDGIVSVHKFADGDCSRIRQFETYSGTFCQASPCHGDNNLIALPSRDDSTVSVVDIRDSRPVLSLKIKDHGMLTSLAMTVSGGGGNRPILACGMESGSAVFHDFSANSTPTRSDIKFCKDPVLAIDMAPSDSSTSSDTTQSSVVAVAGLAGDIAEVSELPEAERGRVVLTKVSHSDQSGKWIIKQRARLETCYSGDNSHGKPGVSICCFRPGDGRIFAVGGWDRRVRLYERATGRPLAILHGNMGSVNAVGWAPDADSSGIIASAGSDDSKVHVWKCFSDS